MYKYTCKKIRVPKNPTLPTRFVPSFHELASLFISNWLKIAIKEGHLVVLLYCFKWKDLTISFECYEEIYDHCVVDWIWHIQEQCDTSKNNVKTSNTSRHPSNQDIHPRTMCHIVLWRVTLFLDVTHPRTARRHCSSWRRESWHCLNLSLLFSSFWFIRPKLTWKVDRDGCHNTSANSSNEVHLNGEKRRGRLAIRLQARGASSGRSNLPVSVSPAACRARPSAIATENAHFAFLAIFGE